jgi:hypothetical protein
MRAFATDRVHVLAIDKGGVMCVCRSFLLLRSLQHAVNQPHMRVCVHPVNGQLWCVCSAVWLHVAFRVCSACSARRLLSQCRIACARLLLYSGYLAFSGCCAVRICPEQCGRCRGAPSPCAVANLLCAKYACAAVIFGVAYLSI